MRRRELDSIARNDDRRQVMEMNAEPLWWAFLERLQPPSLDREFSSTEFELAFVVNVRTALLLADATPACRRFADTAIKTADNYSSLRHSGERGRVLTNAHRAIDEALWRLMTELRNCKVNMDVRAEPSSIYPTERSNRRGATNRTQKGSRMPVPIL
jgi:hypothetical protein